MRAAALVTALALIGCGSAAPTALPAPRADGAPVVCAPPGTEGCYQLGKRVQSPEVVMRCHSAAGAGQWATVASLHGDEALGVGLERVYFCALTGE